MKNLVFSLAFMLIASFGFANTQNHGVVKTHTIENFTNHLKITFDLGDLSNLSETELNNLLDNLPTQVINYEQFAECTITYTLTFAFMGQSLTVAASATAPTCAEAGNIARAGLRSEVDAAKKVVKDIM